MYIYFDQSSFEFLNKEESLEIAKKKKKCKSLKKFSWKINFYEGHFRPLLPVKGTVIQIYNKYIIASTQIANKEIFAFIAVLVFKLLSRKVL